jgi:hypothetical protein
MDKCPGEQRSAVCDSRNGLVEMENDKKTVHGRKKRAQKVEIRVDELMEILCGEGEILYGEEEILYGEKEILYGEMEILCGEVEILYGEEEILCGEEEILYGEEEILCGEEEILCGEEETLNEWSDVRVSIYAALEQERRVEVKIVEVNSSGGDVQHVSLARGMPAKEPCAVHSLPDDARGHRQHPEKKRD